MYKIIVYFTFCVIHLQTEVSENTTTVTKTVKKKKSLEGGEAIVTRTKKTKKTKKSEEKENHISVVSFTTLFILNNYCSFVNNFKIIVTQVTNYLY